nr:unnamed protein product [Spirometra erinaceieuropaei]
MPQGINDRLTTLRLPLRGGKFVTTIDVYTLPTTSFDVTRSQFYENRNALLATVLKEDKLVVLGDFNARTGTECVARSGVPAAYDNDLLLLLLQTCAEHRILLTNAFCSLSLRKKATCVHSDRCAGRCWTIISFSGKIDRTWW